jgi:hypothetical protein
MSTLILLAIFKPLEDQDLDLLDTFYGNKSLHLPNKNTEIMCCKQEKQIKEK